MFLLLACAEPADLTKTAEPGTPTVPITYEGCRGTPDAADRDRVVLTALPYDADANASENWGWRTLSADGSLSDEQGQLLIGRATFGEMSFTPDGSLGLVPLEDGRLGVVTVTDGVPTAQPAFDGGIYATRVLMHPTGELAWVLDGNWVNNGGGVYRVNIDCDTGALGEPELVLAAKLPSDLLDLRPEDDQVVLIAREVGDDADAEVHLLDLPPDGAPTVLSSAMLFDDEDAIISDATLAQHNGAPTVLVGDNSVFSGVPNRVALVGVAENTLTSLDVLSPFNDPFSLYAGPGGAVLVSSGYGDALLWLAPTDDPASPYEDRGEIAYSGGGPALPANIVGVSRGALAGFVLVAENTGVRLVDLSGQTPVDQGFVSFGGGLDQIPGAIGVTP